MTNHHLVFFFVLVSHFYLTLDKKKLKKSGLRIHCKKIFFHI
jgi:hypothetical protein